VDRETGDLARVATEVGGRGYAADVSKKRDVQAVVASIASDFGGIDILVNNAGIIRDGWVENITEEQWDEVLDVNLKGVFLCCQAALPHLKKNRGKIVSISSRSWLGNIGQLNYCASKGGIVSLTRALALECARDGVNVNAVAPGLIDTPLTRAIPEKVRQKLIAGQPSGRMGTTEDIAAAVEFLVSDDAGFITGQVLHVDGGKSCGLLSL
jgi:NAD(P)-dependent dehydrogenase (short-subunit alcohol dehydrogenase family)